MPDRIRSLAKRIAETLPVQSRRRNELFEELRALRADLEGGTPADELCSLDAALLLMEFMCRSDDVATSETFHVVAGLVATIDASRLQPPAKRATPHPLRKVSSDVSEHADLRLTQGFLLGTILLQAGVITQETLARALQLHASSGLPLGQCLVQLGAVSPEQIESAVSYQDRLRDYERSSHPRAASTAQAAPPPQAARTPHAAPPAHVGPPPQAAPPAHPAHPAPGSHPSGAHPSAAHPSQATRGGRSDLRLSPKQHEYVQSMNAQVLGEVLIRLGSITREQLSQALTVQRAASIHIGEALVETGATTWEHVKKALDIQRQLRRYAA